MINLNIFTDNYTYQRNDNHATKELEKKLANMYGAKKVFLTNSGMEAITTLFDYLLPKGGTVVINKDTYHETKQWLKQSKRFYVKEIDFNEFSIFNSLEHDKKIKSIIQDATVFYLDDPSVFGKWHDLTDIVNYLKIFNYDSKVIVDNTMFSFYYSDPIKSKVDYVVESYSKYVSGHGDVMAGAIICTHKPPEDMKKFIGNKGICVNDLTVFLLNRSLQTLAVRMEKHTENAKYIHKKLEEKNIEHFYAGFGGVIIFPGLDEEFCDKLAKLGHFKKCPTFGTTFSTTSFVRSSTSYSIKIFARISCGLEDKKVLWKDLKTALSLSKT
jgi:cystathionine beta-lyase/cystathionine gamma-synthase